MPPLRHSILKRPELYLLILLAIALLMAADGMRPPQRQVSVRLYVAAVHGYRDYVHPLTHHFIRCRYRPTCSNYSVQAVSKYGIFRGFALSLRRLASCRGDVPFGTADPIP